MRQACAIEVLCFVLLAAAWSAAESAPKPPGPRVSTTGGADPSRPRSFSDHTSNLNDSDISDALRAEAESARRAALKGQLGSANSAAPSKAPKGTPAAARTQRTHENQTEDVARSSSIGHVWWLVPPLLLIAAIIVALAVAIWRSERKDYLD